MRSSTGRIVAVAMVDYGVSRRGRRGRARTLGSISRISLRIILFRLVVAARGRSESIVIGRRIILTGRWTRSGVRRNAN